MLANETLYFRAPEPEDLDFFFQWENDTDLWKYGSTIAPFSQYTLKQYIAAGVDFYTDKQVRLMVVLKETQEVVGSVDLFDYDVFHQRAAVGILIDRAHQRQGLGEQALELLKNYATEFLGIRLLYAHVPEKNKESVSLFGKVGFEQTGILRSWIRIGRTYSDVFVMQYHRPELV